MSAPETGTIEEIGLRTTHIRTLANTVIAIPNARLASEPIDNISARKQDFVPAESCGCDMTRHQKQTAAHNGRRIRDLFSCS